MQRTARDTHGASFRAPATRSRVRLGFTLIEIMAVVAIVSLLAALAVPRFMDAVERARVARAIGDLKAIAADISGADALPPSLAAIGRDDMIDPWGRPYVYYPFPPRKGKAPPKGARKDRFLVPINAQFDLYSLGLDGQSAAALTAKASRDDVIVANDGGYIGLASRY